MIRLKKIFLTILLSSGLFCVSSAYGTESVPYKNLKNGAAISVSADGQSWSAKFSKKHSTYFVKKVSEGSGGYSEFYSPDGEFRFSTGCQYEFINKGTFIGYSNHKLKFYEFTFDNGEFLARELPDNEIQGLFKDFRIIKISDFSQSTNSLKIKKKMEPLKLIILNDTDRYFYHYSFSTNNAKISTYNLKGLLKVTKKGMIHFSHFGDNTKDNPWFILLVR